MASSVHHDAMQARALGGFAALKAVQGGLSLELSSGRRRAPAPSFVHHDAMQARLGRAWAHTCQLYISNSALMYLLGCACAPKPAPGLRLVYAAYCGLLLVGLLLTVAAHDLAGQQLFLSSG